LENAYLHAYKEYKAGFLPNDGGWINQPSKYSMIMSLIQGIIVSFEERESNGK